ncbi:DUF4238 domain-containing protein [Palleronia caenipelagi]|uniref:DUF4238 domain-containing protein n=1 Tax=Palleronia caenipelagi TaxID=2489174 RepID=A0A547Q992_9RHOB|nr:DUF4238 domain-containing protein [Palleronia caenipelagi]TRD22957.1 DUF4238 domain-containing protein [Palleronia caenipelagi]
MSVPKRHHWWPQLNSGHWCSTDGTIQVLSRDGSSFRGKPRGLGVVGQLYSKDLADGTKDVSIETWFANDIDGPFASLLKKLIDDKNLRNRTFSGDHKKRKLSNELGLRIGNTIEYMEVSEHELEVLSRYVAALLVRNPNYLKKLAQFHSDQLNPKHSSLDNMRYVFEIYANRLLCADFVILKRDARNEFLFSDGGIVAREPWSRYGGIPFDIHYPMTPDYALQALPAINQNFKGIIHYIKASNTGIAAQNRISLEVAKNQVFGRAPLPKNFVLKNWGRAAPHHIAYRHVDGQLETSVSWGRFYH